MSTAKPINYLNNKDILKEIHASKNSYCVYEKDEYHQYDFIVDYEDNVNLERSLAYASRSEVIDRARENRADREKVSIDSVKATDVIFRVMTWDHIPLAPKQARKVVKSKSAKDIFEFDDEQESVDFEDLEDPELAKEMGMNDMVHVRVNFPPFQHFKLDDFGNLICVGKSHWTGDLKTGSFSKDHGQITNKLAKMYLMLCEKYAMRYNWRGYCVDSDTEALTQRGWLNIDEITTDDIILSYDGKQNCWSSIKSVYREQYTGNMFHLTLRGFDTLITPKHKLVTDYGLIPVEYVRENDRLVLMGSAVDSVAESKYSDSFVELIGLIITDGTYELDNNVVKNITICQRYGLKADRVRNCLTNLGFSYTETAGKNKTAVFTVDSDTVEKLVSVFPTKNLTMSFILSINNSQRQLLIDTMTVENNKGQRKLKDRAEKSQLQIDMFAALCAISGVRTVTHKNKQLSIETSSEYRSINVLAERNNYAVVSNIDFHGAKNSGRSYPGLGKVTHPNNPTVHYDGMVWCPETEYGCFVARRNGTVYLTGNTYVDEMKASAILQLTYVGLRFNEAKSQNPFAYYTAAVNNSFRRVLNMEKRNQNIRDDILEINGLNPSWTRQFNDGGGSED